MTTRQPRQARSRQAQSRQGQSTRSQPRGSGSRRPPARTTRPLPKGDTLYTPGADNVRRAVERTSAKPMAFLHQLPAWLLPIALVALLVVGFAVKGWGGAAALLVVTAFLGWLAYVSWPALALRGRLLRVAGLVVMVALAAFQASR